MLCGRKESCVVFRAVLARKANDSEDDTEPHEYAEVQAAAGLAASIPSLGSSLRQVDELRVEVVSLQTSRFGI